jgi:hypothetical protein
MGNELNRQFSKEKSTYAQQIHEKLFNILSHQGVAN